MNIYGQEEQKKKVAQIQERLLERQSSDLKKILDMPEGRRLLWRILKEARIFHAHPDEAQPMAVAEGARRLGLTLFSEILSARPESFTAMQREAASDKLERESELKEISQ